MANATKARLIKYDTVTGASWTGTKYVWQAQWIDDAGDIADGDTLAFTVNGVSLSMTLQAGGFGTPAGTVWNVGPFGRPHAWDDFTLSTLTHGALWIWLA